MTIEEIKQGLAKLKSLGDSKSSLEERVLLIESLKVRTLKVHLHRNYSAN